VIAWANRSAASATKRIWLGALIQGLSVMGVGCVPGPLVLELYPEWRPDAGESPSTRLIPIQRQHGDPHHRAVD
jgi:hypothetical protein